MSELVAEPLANVNEEAIRVAGAITQAKVPLRLIGGGAIYLRCPSARQADLRRAYADLDFVGLGERGIEFRRFFEGLGYEPNSWFNKLHGRTRLLFWDKTNGRQADVFLDRMNMCHVLDFRSQLEIDPQTLSLADLLLTKLQIVEMNRKDLIDVVALLIDHAIGSGDGEEINGAHIARLTAGDWGLYRTAHTESGVPAAQRPRSSAASVDCLLIHNWTPCRPTSTALPNPLPGGSAPLWEIESVGTRCLRKSEGPKGEEHEWFSDESP